MKIFQDWITEHFCPSVKHYCEIKKLEQRALLLIDNAQNHPTNLSDFQQVRSSKARRSVIDALSSYRCLLDKKAENWKHRIVLMI